MLEDVCDRVILDRATRARTSCSKPRNSAMSHWRLPSSSRRLPIGVGGRDREGVAKRTVHAFDTQLSVQDQQRFAQRVDDVVGVLARDDRRLLRALERVDVDQDQDRAVDLIVELI